MYGSEIWTFTKKDEAGFGSSYNFELYRIYQGPDIVRSIKIGRLRWMGHVMRMNALLDKRIGK